MSKHEKYLIEFAKKSFKWAKKNPGKLLSVTVSVIQLGNPKNTKKRESKKFLRSLESLLKM